MTRALLGGPLEGQKVMRLVYVDEAGIGNPAHEPFLVVAAVLVHADNTLTAVERHLDRLVERHIPEPLRDGFVFHATEIFNGGKVLKREEWPIERRLAIARDLAAIPKKFGLNIAIGFVERATFPQMFDFGTEFTKGEQAVAAHVTAFVQCSIFVERWMRRHAPQEVCMMIVEDNDQARSTIRELQSAYQKSQAFDPEDARSQLYLPFRKIKEDPLFQRKRKSSVLQVADFCAYVSKRVVMNDDHYWEYYQAFKEKIVLAPELELAKPSE
jgi:hypothetical protein